MAFFSDSERTRRVGNLELWSLNGDVMLHLLSGYKLEPYFLLSAGYSAFAGVDDAVNGFDY